MAGGNAELVHGIRAGCTLGWQAIGRRCSRGYRGGSTCSSFAGSSSARERSLRYDAQLRHRPLSTLVGRRLGGLCSLSCSQVNDARKESFALVNGVRLHYVDWGGQDECLLFLTPLGGDLLEQFGTLAAQFTDRFRVLGLTRRGQGRSDKPAGDYDTDTLARDIVGFLDEMGVARANVAGQSIAGAEMTRLAVVHPSRVSKLVYLDAAVDYKASAELAKEAGLGPPDDPALAAILQGAARGEFLILRNTTHGGFVAERQQQDKFVPVMREFLLRP